MEVKLKLNDTWYDATNSRGATIKLGSEPKDAVSPMEAVLMAAGGCSGIDVVSILKKMRQPLEGLEITVSGDRRDDYPRYYEQIKIMYGLKGKLDPAKVKRAIELSLDKYCSVTNGLIPKAQVKYEFTIESGEDL